MTEAERPDTLVVRKTIPASREEVFAAWIDPDSLRHWMCPGDILTAEAELDPRVGGAYRIVMKGRTGDYDHTGEYLEGADERAVGEIDRAGSRPAVLTR
jgi:uncharacterized protein YndB with AHSA1/START domain